MGVEETWGPVYPFLGWLHGQNQTSLREEKDFPFAIWELANGSMVSFSFSKRKSQMIHRVFFSL